MTCVAVFPELDEMEYCGEGGSSWLCDFDWKTSKLLLFIWEELTQSLEAPEVTESEVLAEDIKRSRLQMEVLLNGTKSKVTVLSWKGPWC